MSQRFLLRGLSGFGSRGEERGELELTNPESWYTAPDWRFLFNGALELGGIELGGVL